jgi:hypothetical protein
VFDYADKGFVNYAGWLSEEDGEPGVLNGTGSVKFSDSSGNEVLTYPSGDPQYVHLEDSDRNADTGSAETVTVTVLSETEDAGESLTLTETGTNTGIFMGSMDLEEAAASSGDGALQASRGDKLTVSYDDPADDFGNSVTR